MDELVERLIELLEKQRSTVQEETDRLEQLSEVVQRGGAEQIAASTRELLPTLLELERSKSVQVRQAIAVAREIGEEGGGEPPPASEPTSIARQFRSVIDTLTLESRTDTAHGLGTTLRSMDVEIKGLIVVEDGQAAIVTPTPSRRMDPGQLSSIRMSFASVPLVPVETGVEDDEE